MAGVVVTTEAVAMEEVATETVGMTVEMAVEVMAVGAMAVELMAGGAMEEKVMAGVATSAVAVCSRPWAQAAAVLAQARAATVAPMAAVA